MDNNNKDYMSKEKKTQTIKSFGDLGKVARPDRLALPIKSTVGNMLAKKPDIYKMIVEFLDEFAHDPLYGYVIKAHGLRMLQQHSPGNSTYPLPVATRPGWFFSFPDMSALLEWLTETSKLLKVGYSCSVHDIKLPSALRRLNDEPGKFVSISISRGNELVMHSDCDVNHKPVRYLVPRLREFNEAHHIKSRRGVSNTGAGVDHDELPDRDFVLPVNQAKPSMTKKPSKSYVPNGLAQSELYKQRDRFEKLLADDLLKIVQSGIIPGTPGTSGYSALLTSDRSDPELTYSGFSVINRISNNVGVGSGNGIVLQELLSAKGSDGVFVSVGVIYNDKFGFHREVNAGNQFTLGLHDYGLELLDYSVFVVIATNVSVRTVLLVPRDISDFPLRFGTESEGRRNTGANETFMLRAPNIADPAQLASNVLANYGVKFEPDYDNVVDRVDKWPSGQAPIQGYQQHLAVSLASRCPIFVNKESVNTHRVAIIHRPVFFSTINVAALKNINPEWGNLKLTSYVPTL